MSAKQLSLPLPDETQDEPSVAIDYSFLVGGYANLRDNVQSRVAEVTGGTGDTILESQLTPEVRGKINSALYGVNVEITFGEKSVKIIKGNEDDSGEYWQV